MLITGDVELFCVCSQENHLLRNISSSSQPCHICLDLLCGPCLCGISMLFTGGLKNEKAVICDITQLGTESLEPCCGGGTQFKSTNSPSLWGV